MDKDKIITKVKNGEIKGVVVDNTVIYKGIPYAKPPVGDLRFAPPQDVEPWQGTLDCTNFKNCSVQEPSILVNTVPSEDCLYLNVWAPKEKPASPLPVFFWIHGGGFFNGCGTMNYYDGSEFVKNGVIVVTINYRLGALGFLALETLRGKYNTTGNWGTLDQIAALKWTKENIAAFGGDVENITIAGESAGSFSVSNLVMSPLAKGLFNRAIMQSGCILSNKVAVPHTEAKLQPSIEMSRKFAELFGADDSEEGLRILRQADAKKLWIAGFFSSDATVESPMAFWPVLDGTVLPQEPLKALKAGNYNKADFIIGFNRDEGAVFISEQSTMQGGEKFINNIFKENASKIFDYYKEQGIQDLNIIVDAVTYAYFKAGINIFSTILSEQGMKVYSYQFNHTPGGNYPMKALGAHHASDILYTFASMEKAGLTPDDSDRLVEKQMNTMWSNFVTDGSPNIGLDFPVKNQWVSYTPDICMTYYFDDKMECLPLKDKDKISFFISMLY